jgi:methylated-DNA-[protein]-cysteine S-methyltransferase
MKMDGTHRTWVDTPVGTLVIEAHDEVLTHIHLPSGAPAQGRASASGRHRGQRGGKRLGTDAPLARAVRQLQEYFSGSRREFDLPLELSGTDFQCRVWRALAEIPYGSVVSYAELAAMVGRPSAFRAVGQANGANPLPIVLPCHRVVASGGRIGGYGGGVDMKRRLLALEGVPLA